MAFDGKMPSTSNLTSESSQYWDNYFQYLEQELNTKANIL